MPRFVFERVHRAVDSMASRTVAPMPRVPAPASGSPIAAALARKSS